MTSIADLKSKSGLLLYRQLPEEYRFLDLRNDEEPGDLEAYLHGFGHLLDLIRGTTEQAYADAFAEKIDFPSQKTEENRAPQTWILPYLAELVGAELMAPDPQQRVKELSETVTWFKSKGTLRSVNSVADVVSGLEAVVVEGWRRVAATPRLKLPPFAGPATLSTNTSQDGATTSPMGTPDLRHHNRPVIDPDGSNPLQRLVFPKRDANGHIAPPDIVHFKASSTVGAPCFPDSFGDTSVRTPDVRDPVRNIVGPNPRRTLLYVRPPMGFFEDGLKTVAFPAGTNPLGLSASGVKTIGPTELLKAAGAPTDGDSDLTPRAPDKLVVTGDFTVPVGVKVQFENLLFMGTITVPADATQKRLAVFSRCAIAKIKIEGTTDDHALEVQDSLIGEIFAPSSTAQIIHCTVLGDTQVNVLQASDCIFAGKLVDVKCAEKLTCVRHSRISSFAELQGCDLKNNPNLCTDDPNFISLYFLDAAICNLRPAKFGEPGCGVLDSTTSSRISAGSETGGELGAYNHLFHGARLAAMQRKLADFLPFGQEISFRYDAHLMRRPATPTQ